MTDEQIRALEQAVIQAAREIRRLEKIITERDAALQRIAELPAVPPTCATCHHDVAQAQTCQEGVTRPWFQMTGTEAAQFHCSLYAAAERSGVITAHPDGLGRVYLADPSAAREE